MVDHRLIFSDIDRYKHFHASVGRAMNGLLYIALLAGFTRNKISAEFA